MRQVLAEERPSFLQRIKFCYQVCKSVEVLLQNDVHELSLQSETILVDERSKFCKLSELGPNLGTLADEDPSERKAALKRDLVLFMFEALSSKVPDLAIQDIIIELKKYVFTSSDSRTKRIEAQLVGTLNELWNNVSNELFNIEQISLLLQDIVRQLENVCAAGRGLARL